MSAAVRARGQAMAEFCVAAAMLALLLLGLPVLARYHDTQFNLIVQSRLTAMLHSWSPQQRIDAQALRRSGFAPLDDPRRPEVSGLDVTTGSTHAPGTLARVAELALEPVFVVGSLGGSGLNVERAGYVRAALSAEVVAQDQALLPAPFDALNLTLQEHHVLLGDAWNSASPAQVADRTSGLVPTAAFASLRLLLAPVRMVASVVEPSLGQLCLGQIDPEKVPADRLGGSDDDLTRTRWTAPC